MERARPARTSREEEVTPPEGKKVSLHFEEGRRGNLANPCWYSNL